MPDRPHLDFHKSSYSSARQENCVEIAEFPGGAAVRDSKRPGDGHLTFPAAEWQGFVTGAVQGEL